MAGQNWDERGKPSEELRQSPKGMESREGYSRGVTQVMLLAERPLHQEGVGHEAGMPARGSAILGEGGQGTYDKKVQVGTVRATSKGRVNRTRKPMRCGGWRDRGIRAGWLAGDGAASSF